MPIISHLYVCFRYFQTFLKLVKVFSSFQMAPIEYQRIDQGYLTFRLINKTMMIFIMNTEKKDQLQSVSAQQKIFQRIYNKKFVNQASSGLVERRRIVASQLKSKKYQDQEQITNGSRPSIKGRSKSIGSLLPQIKEIEIIANSQKLDSRKPRSNSLSKLQIYLSQKNIKKTQQLNILFLTQSVAVVPDRVINEKFSSFVAVNQQSKPKNLRALLNLTGGLQVSQQVKLAKIGKQKQQLTQIIKNMIEQHHANQDLKHRGSSQLKNQQGLELQQDEQQEESVNNPIQNSSSKSIDWVLKQCKKYDRKFRVKKKKKKAKSKKTLEPAQIH